MTVPTNEFQTYAAIGNREDLEDIIYDISPTETPFMSNAARMDADATYHEWQTDALAAAGANLAIEGDDATGTTITPTVRVGNYTQILTKTVIVSETQRANKSAGRGDERSYQITKEGKALKRDIEYALARNQASSAGGAGTARALASIEGWLATNKTSVGTGTAQTTPGFSGSTVVAPTDSTVAGASTEAALKDVISKCWDQGGDPTVIMTGKFNKTKVSGYGGISTQYTQTPQKAQATLIGGADVYVSDFGVHSVVPNRFSRDQTILVLDFEYIGVAYLRPFKVTPLAKTGDSTKDQIVTELTLVVKNEAASGKVTDCTTA